MTTNNGGGGDGDNGSGARKRRRLHNDRPPSPRTTSSEPITINVGGTLFRMSTATLINSSAYFESMLSARWRGSDANYDSDDQNVIFVDQDPVAFETLVSFMRSGVVHLHQQDAFLSKNVLMLAEYLGINGFLVSVKAITMKNISRREDYLSDDVSEAAEFDARFGSLQVAVEKGILPLCFFPPSDDLAIRVADRVFHASKTLLVEKSAYFSRVLTSLPDNYWKEEITLSENAEVVLVVLQMLGSPNSAFTTMTEKFHSVGTDGQNAKFRHFYVQAILTLIDKLQIQSIEFRDNCVQTITHTFNA